MFNISQEISLPTLYATLLWAFAVVLLAIITHARKRARSSHGYWLALTLISLYLLIDESVMLHEKLGELYSGAEKLSPFLYFDWVIPYGVLVIIISVIFYRFILALPPRIRFLFVLAGSTFVLGALGIEVISARHYVMYGRDSFYWLLLVPIEEALEQTGLVIYIYGLLLYIGTELNGLSIEVQSGRKRQLNAASIIAVRKSHP